MLDAVAELARDSVGNVDRVLGDEIDADALGADQAHHLLDLLEQRLGRIIEQQMRLVEEEAELGLVRIADLGKRSSNSWTAARAGRWRRGAGLPSACRRRGC
jgi:hypothetical protein